MTEETRHQKGMIADLDGVFYLLVNHAGEYGVSARTLKEVKIIDGLSEALDDLIRLGFIIIGVTNQPDVARGKITKRFLVRKHAMIRAKYPQFRDILVCPHTETNLCGCRKPKPGLLRQAGKKYNLDFALSWMIGDSRADVEAGVLVHARTILIQTPYNCADPAIDKATAVARSTIKALKLIVDLEKGQTNREDS